MDFAALQIDRDLPSGLAVYSAPAAEPISTATAKNHLRVDSDMSDDDTLIDALVTAARMHVEDVCGLALITQTLDWYLEAFPSSGEIWLPRSPAASVTSITYTDQDDAAATVSASTYSLVTAARPPRVVLKFGQSWPFDPLQAGLPVKVRYVAGFGAAGSSVPRPILQAMLLLIGHWYENREAVIDTGRKTLLPVPLAVDSLLFPYRVWQ